MQNQPEYLETTNASIIGVVTPSPAKPAYVKSLLEQGESTSVALIRMITTNMQMIATDDFKFRQLERRKSILSSTRAKSYKQ